MRHLHKKRKDSSPRCISEYLTVGFANATNHLLRFTSQMYWQFSSLGVLENKDAPHTIQDDMESIYYVVLYCALLYLPHHIDGNELLCLLGLLFDFNTVKNSTRASGGMVKSADLHRGAHTGDLPWTQSSKPIREWLEAVRGDISQYSYKPPKPPALADHADGWTPASFKTFWDTFLSTHGSKLPRNDRTDHIKANRAPFAKTAPRSALDIAFQPTIPCAYNPPASTAGSTSTTAAPHASSSTAVRMLGPWRIPPDPTGRVSTPSPGTGPPLTAVDTPGSTLTPNPASTTVGLSDPIRHLKVDEPAEDEIVHASYFTTSAGTSVTYPTRVQSSSSSLNGPIPVPGASVRDTPGVTKSKGKSTSVDARPTKRARRSSGKA